MPELRRYWPMAAAAVVLRLALVFFPGDLNLGSRPEVATPLSSLRRLAEGYWLKQTSLSPYAGSMYHGSPLLLPVLGPLIVNRTEGRPMYFYCSLLFVIVDFISAILIRAIGQKLFASNRQSMNSLKLSGKKILVNENAGDVASLIYLWNPLTIVTCLGSCTTPIDNFMVILTIYGACSRIAPLAAFGYVMATHLSLYPAILIVPVILLLGHGLDAPPSKLFTRNTRSFSWKPVIYFIIWAIIWTCYVLLLCSISLKGAGDLNEMFKNIPQPASRTSKKICTPGKNPGYAPDTIPELDILSCTYPNIPFKGTYGFILTVEDLTPNIGVLWYFFAEVFEFFRDFFLIVFHVNILFMVLPLAIRLKHRPCFLAFVYVAVVAMLKSYPSVGDSALYLGLLGLFASELADMQFSFFLFFGYIGVTLLSPVMHNLWIWRGTGNANFYFATGLAYACLQTVLVVESVSSMLKHDRMLKKLSSP